MGKRGGRPRPTAKAKAGVRGGADEVLENLIEQFADPFAFVRELVQNALDAGSLRIDVQVSAQPAEGGRVLLGIAVQDTGEGMTAEIIDEYLVTLFRSSKTDDMTKIGKFGIGFVSVFALQPDLVVVDTARGGERWKVLFHPDRRYERLAEKTPMEGTRVELLKYVDAETARDFTLRTRQALERWCRHCRAELWFVAPGAAPERVDRPMGLEAEEARPVVEARHGDEHLVLGVPTALARHCFYNQGLLLHERSSAAADGETPAQPLLVGTSLKLDSPHLEHTLTRDNVLMDAHYAQAMARAAQLVGSGLMPRVVDRLQAIAAELSGDQAGEPEPEREAKLEEHLLDEHLRLLSWLLLQEGALDAFGERPLLPAFGRPAPLSLLGRAKAGAWLVSDGKSHVTELLLADGVVVVPRLIDQQWRKRLGRDLADTLDVHEDYLAAVPVEGHQALIERVKKLAAAGGVEPKELRLGRLDYEHGRFNDRPYVAAATSFGLVQRTAKFERGLFRAGPPALVLNAAHPVVADALRLEATAPTLAAVVLARLVLVGERGGELPMQALLLEALAGGAAP